jgi:hypothetical protein
LNIALVGAPGTGKSWLAQALQDAQAREPRQHRFQDAPPISDVRAFDVVLLMGLDLFQPTAEVLQADQTVRAALAEHGSGFRVVYGHGAARLTNAQRAMATAARGASTPWRHTCDTCSDPDCEHQLFSSLLQGAGGPLQAG